MKTLKSPLNLLFVASFMLAALIACDKIEAPYTESSPPPPPPTPGTDTNIGTVHQKFLIEEFSGHKCTYCPTANKKAADLQAQYPDNLILLTIHVTDLATPDASGHYTYDFRSRTGNDIAAKYIVPNVPKTMLSRIPYNGNRIMVADNLNSALAAHITDTPSIKLAIKPTFDSTSNQLSVTVDATFLKNLTDTFNLCVYITEDSIVKPQKNNNPNIGPLSPWLNYVHRHILRDALTPTNGELLVSGSIQKWAKFSKTFNYSLNPAWNKKHCHIIAFIYDPGDDIIRQVEEKHIMH